MSDVSFYETDQAVSEYLLLHFASRDEVLPYSFGPSNALNYPVRCIVECVDKALLPFKSRGWTWAARWAGLASSWRACARRLSDRFFKPVY